MTRKTSAILGGGYGPDGGKRLVVTLTPGPDGDDMLTIRPLRTRRGETVLVADVYAWALRCRITAEARERKRR